MIVEVKNLVKRYDRLVALDHFNLVVEEGEIYGMLGPNGSGKTTAIYCILSLLKYDKGVIKIFDIEMTELAYGIKRDIGIVMQKVAVFNELNVSENISYFCSLYIKNMSEVKRLTQEVINLVGLNEYSKYHPNKLSQGQLARLNLACGIVHNPKLLFLDEPTLNADPHSKQIIYNCIKELNNKGTTIIYSTQSVEEVELLCHRISFVDRGKVIASGTQDEIKGMISIGEIITVEVYNLTETQLEDISSFISITDIGYKDSKLVIRSKKGSNNLILILDYMQKNGLNFGKVYSEIPTLNDVFLEITGKML